MMMPDRMNDLSRATIARAVDKAMVDTYLRVPHRASYLAIPVHWAYMWLDWVRAKGESRFPWWQVCFDGAWVADRDLGQCARDVNGAVLICLLKPEHRGFCGYEQDVGKCVNTSLAGVETPIYHLFKVVDDGDDSFQGLQGAHQEYFLSWRVEEARNLR